MLNEATKRLIDEWETATSEKTLKKAVFSRPRDKSAGKTVLTFFEKNGQTAIKSERFTADGKALQSILSKKEAYDLVLASTEQFKQINLIANGASLELIISDKGKFRFTGSLVGAKKAELSESQDKKKSYIITPETDGDFLRELGITDKNGRIHDKKQAKYRQINKFLEQIEAVSDALPSEGELCICDLCCGKSYLTFAVYRYFTHHKHRKVKMHGIDLKSDVIDYCTDVAKRLGYVGMSFECGDVSSFKPERTPDLVISLHACDVATDFALAGAVRSGARVILSTPCCQHELASKIDCDTLDFALDFPILKQKIASSLTDALRARLLEIHGYKVTVCELIDPDETPKNVIIRAVKSKRCGDLSEKIRKYIAAKELLCAQITLENLLPLPEAAALPLKK